MCVPLVIAIGAVATGCVFQWKRWRRRVSVEIDCWRNAATELQNEKFLRRVNA